LLFIFEKKIRFKKEYIYIMALFYVNPCSIGMGKKKQKEGGRSKETRKGEKKREKNC
jgi:hypothetical protein